MVPEPEFLEATAVRSTEAVPLSHLSVEVGHFYRDDLANGAGYFQEHFSRIAHWVAAARAACAAALPAGRPRVSTCLLIDDYFERPTAPWELVPRLVEAAEHAGLTIDYLARESACAAPVGVADPTGGADASTGPSPAELMMARLVEEPPPGATGARPATRETGWLSNGRRSPATGWGEAMKTPASWAPPVENVPYRHSIFMDVELWSGPSERRLWSCAALAAVWQLVRLGALRDEGRAVLAPHPPPDVLPDDWRRMPAVTRLNRGATPFCAYRTLSICAPLFLPVEHAVRVILEQVALDPEVGGQILARGAAERFEMPPAAVDRIEYLFLDTGPVRNGRTG